MKRKICLIGLMILMVGCSEPATKLKVMDSTVSVNREIDVKPDVEENDDLLEILNEAEKITIKEAFFSLNPHYEVYVDNQQVGTVTGKYIQITGDVFTLADMNGNTYASEKQIKRWGIKLNRLAEVFDKEGKTVGFIGEEKFRDFF